MEYIPAKTIVTRNKNTVWFGTEYNMNIYKGCCHGCIYCDSRSECYRIEHFDTVKAKANALEIIRDELSRKVKTGVVATGSMSDPYNPFEKKQLLTRHALELLNAYGFGVSIATKGTLVIRDIDLLKEIQMHSPVIVETTITTSSDELSKKVEPGAPLTSERFESIAQLAKNKIFTGVLLMPILPFLEDTEENVLTIAKCAYESGAKFIVPSFGVTLRDNQRLHFYQKLEEIFPGQNLAQQYAKRYGHTYACNSSKAKKLYAAFVSYCNKTGMLYKMPEIIRAYKMGYTNEQISMF